MSGVLCVYKPRGITSHDVVDRVRELTGERRVGHAGTLDPLAEGVLIVLVGRSATRQQARFMSGEKEYLATLRLGSTSATDDAEGPITTVSDSQPELSSLKSAVEAWVGDREQVPPAYSAIKLQGKKAYEVARSGAVPKLQARPVSIREIEILHYTYPNLELRIICSKGTYIRSLARDIGDALGVGAYLSRLIRSKSGSFSTEDAVALDSLTPKNIDAHLAKSAPAP